MEQSAGSWRIDELAQRSGVGVDTIRFYGREGLLPPASREGRSLRYGFPHLERLHKIKELQARHFTLAGIKDLVVHDRLDLLDRLLGHSQVTLSYAELVDHSGLPREIVDALADLGVLAQPEKRGGVGFDPSDLSAMRAISRLLAAGMPTGVMLLLAQIYLKQMSALSEQLVNTFAGDTDLSPYVSPEELNDFFARATEDVAVFQSQIDVLMEYLHRRTLEKLVVDTVEDSTSEEHDG